MRDRLDSIRWTTQRQVRGSAPGIDRNFENSLTDANGERKPALGHGPDYDNPTEHPLARAARYLDLVTHDGHVVAFVLNSGAADVRNDGSQRAERLAKARYFGWFPLDSCIVRLIKSGTIKPERIVAKALLDPKTKVCPKGSRGCEHSRAERDARQALNRERMDDLERAAAAQATRERQLVAAASSQGVAEALAPILAELVKARK